MKDFVFEESKKWLMRWVFIGLTALVIAVWTPVGNKVMDIWNSPTQLEEIQETLKTMNESISALTGSNRITRQPEDMSYVQEPVSVGMDIVLVLFIGRTDAGAGCILIEIIPQFTDENNVTFPGEARRPAMQLKTNVVKRIVKLKQPSEVSVAGRVRLQMQLEYTCGTETVFEMTKPVFYYALEKSDEAND